MRVETFYNQRIIERTSDKEMKVVSTGNERIVPQTLHPHYAFILCILCKESIKNTEKQVHRLFSSFIK
jgi:hypothetical protein